MSRSVGTWLLLVVHVAPVQMREAVATLKERVTNAVTSIIRQSKPNWVVSMHNQHSIRNIGNFVINIFLGSGNVAAAIA